MGQFNFSVTAVGAHGCDRNAKPGDRLYGRCGKLTCPDCLSYDFVQMLKQKGFTVGEATFTHFPKREGSEVVDNLVTNERVSGEL